MSNSSLVTYTNITSKSNPRNHVIDTITIHCFVGQVTAKEGCDFFCNTTRRCSVNYVVGRDGTIGLNVKEENRAWTTGSAENDHRAVTIEVASNTVEPYDVTDKAYNALINLVTDICQRNGINKLVWSTNKNDRVKHLNGCNMTVHRDYENKSCPGTYLYGKHGEIATLVNSKLSSGEKPQSPITSELYRVRKTWEDHGSQLGAFKDLNNAKKLCDQNPGYSVFDQRGQMIYTFIAINDADITKLANQVIDRETSELGSNFFVVMKKVSEIINGR